MSTQRSTAVHPPRPFGHFRLVAFFVVLGLVCAGLGVWRLRALGAGASSAALEWTLVASTLACAAIGFAGVFFHRLRVNPVRWRETQSFVAAIRRESEKYRALMEGAADMLLVVDPSSGAILEWSTRAKDELRAHASPDDTPGRGRVELMSLVGANDRARLRAALEESANAPGASISLEELHVNAVNGRALIADARLAAVEVEGLRVVQVSLRDVTRQKEMERSLRVHERLSSIGLLTAGVAHEINNPLEGIGNYLKLLGRDDVTPENRKRYLELVGHGFARIQEIVRDLLRFARPKSGEGKADLALVVERARALASYADNLRGIEIETHGLDKPLNVVGDSGRLEQVVVNLLLNAATAMKGRGKIEIRARQLQSEIELAVADDGPGIPAQDLPRVFDPFFTTTEGTGLGLSVSYGIVQAHGGRISAHNRPNGGATFEIRLPAEPRA